MRVDARRNARRDPWKQGGLGDAHRNGVGRTISGAARPVQAALSGISMSSAAPPFARWVSYHFGRAPRPAQRWAWSPGFQYFGFTVLRPSPPPGDRRPLRLPGWACLANALATAAGSRPTAIASARIASARAS